MLLCLLCKRVIYARKSEFTNVLTLRSHSTIGVKIDIPGFNTFRTFPRKYTIHTKKGANKFQCTDPCIKCPILKA